MPQFEAIMFVVLGFVLATLIALLIGRGIWAYAVRALRRRGERDRPPELARVQAERDQFRAECAKLSLNLKLRFNDLKTQLAERTAEISRNRNRIEPLEAKLAHLTQSLQRLKEQLRDRDEAVNGRHRELANTHALIASHDREIDALRARPTDLETTSTSEDLEAAPAYERLSRRIGEGIPGAADLATC